MTHHKLSLHITRQPRPDASIPPRLQLPQHTDHHAHPPHHDTSTKQRGHAQTPRDHPNPFYIYLSTYPHDNSVTAPSSRRSPRPEWSPASRLAKASDHCSPREGESRDVSGALRRAASARRKELRRHLQETLACYLYATVHAIRDNLCDNSRGPLHARGMPFVPKRHRLPLHTLNKRERPNAKTNSPPRSHRGPPRGADVTDPLEGNRP